MVWYWSAAVVLMLINGCCVTANLFMLPGNWLMPVALITFILTKGTTAGPGWMTVLIVVGLALIGEVLEAAAGAASAARLGASRRSLLLSFVFSVAGSIAGAVMLPVPIVGSAVGAILGAASGAFAGAWLGESWKGNTQERRTEIGTAAMKGRMVGMFAKFSIGLVIFVFQLISLWF